MLNQILEGMRAWQVQAGILRPRLNRGKVSHVLSVGNKKAKEAYYEKTLTHRKTSIDDLGYHKI
jgi:hypothetical protein